MSASQRRKGAAAEREVAALLREHLGQVVQRNLAQSRDGGHDLQIDVGGKLMVIEVKRQERVNVQQALRQVLENEADYHGVIWRPSRSPWMTAMPIDDWMKVIREAM